MTIFRTRLFFAALLACLLSSCAFIKPYFVIQQDLRASQQNYCAPPNPYVYDSTYIPLRDIKPLINSDPLLSKKYSYQDLLLANASGVLFFLQEMVHLQENKTDDEDSLVYQLVKKQEIINRLILASTEVSSIAAELDCESEHVKQLASNLDQLNDDRIQKLTLLSVVSGAVTAVATSLIKDNAVQASVGITGSIISAVFGGLAAISSKRCVIFKHEHNLLADIWNEPATSTNYPPFIWFVLNTKEFTNTGLYSTIRSLKDRWIEDGLLTVKNNEQKELLFGKGGKYRSEDLHVRVNMLNQLKVEIRSINQHLQSLLLKLSV